MKSALISPNETVVYVSAWLGRRPIYIVIPNSERVAEVAASPFEVAPPLFWVSCEDNVVADLFYYDSVTTLIQPIPEAPPQPPQPTTSGTQTL
jgi:hypothetical protein